ncbi:hypothetical protein BC940DRAFT_311196 [Gongronella butleri]|nr:hypothetical protein BC940DRAFT_311196 [Gongronella butleri]
MDLDALLAREIEDLNRDNPDDRRIASAVIMERPDPNAFDGDTSSSEDDDDDYYEGGGGRRGRFGFLRFGRSSSPAARPHYRSYAPGSDDYEDDLAIRDPELFKITERNRRISYDVAADPKLAARAAAAAQAAKTTANDDDKDDDEEKSRPLAANGASGAAAKPRTTITTVHEDDDLSNKPKKRKPRPSDLTFSEIPIIDTQPNRIHVQFDYGASTKHIAKRSRRYLMACDFSNCSLNAMDFAMGTLLRSGDVVHVASVIAMDDDIDSMDEDDKYRLWQELDRNSKMLISKVKSILERLLLYNIKIHTYSLAGPTRESLMGLIQSLSLTMVVCGTSGRRALKGMFMGGVSTYLVQKSRVPVTVVRPQDKQKKKKKRLTPAQKLSQSVREGYLKVDEMETPDHRSINSHDGY